MAISFANIQPAVSAAGFLFGSGANTTALTTNAQPFVAGRAYIVLVTWFTPATSLNSVTTSGITWTQIGTSQLFQGGSARGALMLGLCTVSGTKGMTFNFSTNMTYGNTEYALDEISGADVTAPVVQSAQTATSGTFGDYSVSLSAFAPGSAAYMMTTHDGSGSTFTPKSGWTTIIADNGYFGSSAYLLTADTSPSYKGGTSRCMWAMEIAATPTLTFTNKAAASAAANTTVNVPVTVTAGEYYMLAFMGTGAPTVGLSQLGISFTQVANVSYRASVGGLYVWGGFASTSASGNLSFTTSFSGAGWYSIEAATDMNATPIVQTLTTNNGNVTMATLASENNAVYVYSNSQTAISGFTTLSSIANATSGTNNIAQWQKGSYTTPLTMATFSSSQALVAFEFAVYTPPPPPSNGRQMLLGVGS